MRFVDEQPHPRFGVWAPVYGAWGSHQHPEDPADAGYHRSRELALRAEAAGFTSMLLAQHIVNPSQPDFDVLETWSAAAGIAEATERMEVIAAIKPLLVHPGVLAKMALGIDHISRGRFAINLVSAWFRPEMSQLGIEMPEHDERYVQSAEWLSLVRELWSGESVTHRGARYSTDGLALRPGPYEGRPPLVYLGGESEPGRALAAAAADVFFINGRPLEPTSEIIADLRGRPRAGDPLRFGLAAFVIARESEQEAQAELESLRRYASLDDRSSVIAGRDPNTVMMKANVDPNRIGTNGGTTAGLIGSYEQVAARIEDFADAGVELFMLQFQPLERELERFGAEVIPRVRAKVGAPA